MQQRRRTTYGVVGLVPVADEDGVVGGGRRERDGDLRAAEHADAAEPAGGLVEGQRGEVVVGADLVLGLHDVGEVGARRDRARRAGHAVLERIPPLLEPAPAQCQCISCIHRTRWNGMQPRFFFSNYIKALFSLQNFCFFGYCSTFVFI